MGNNSETNESSNVVKNTRVKDSGAKLIFDDPILCAQFLRGYIDVDLLKDVQPEDIEDISERFVSMWQEERESDSVKKVHLKNSENPEQETAMYLITIIEHQSKVHYDMAFRLLRYIVMVLTDYQSEQEKLHPHITETKDFKYPPIIPIVYYDGTDTWTAVQNFKDRVYLSDVLGKYIPNFEYIVMRLTSYTDAELVAKNDELSLLFLINKLRNSKDFKNLKDIPNEYLQNINQNTPEYLLKLISKIISILLYRINIPRKEVEEFTDQIERRNFTVLFENFEAYDVQETRRVSKEEGRMMFLIEQVCKKIRKKNTISEIAEMLEIEENVIQDIYNVAVQFAPEYDVQKIMEKIKDNK